MTISFMYNWLILKQNFEASRFDLKESFLVFSHNCIGFFVRFLFSTGYDKKSK